MPSLQKYRIIIFPPNFFKKTFSKNSVLFRFVQKPSLDCALAKSVNAISNLSNSKTTEKELSIE